MKSLKSMLAASFVVGALTLSACSSGSEQTVDEACGVIGDGLITLTQIDTSDSLDPFITGLDDISKDVKNSDVKGAWDGYVSTMKEMVQLLSDNSDVTDAEDVTDELLEKEEDLLNRLEESQNKLDDLCSSAWQEG